VVDLEYELLVVLLCESVVVFRYEYLVAFMRILKSAYSSQTDHLRRLTLTTALAMTTHVIVAFNLRAAILDIGAAGKSRPKAAGRIRTKRSFNV
jgi:hypothetical protein